MEKVARLLAHRIEVMRLSREIGQQTKAALDERQREVLLREQMAAIQRQLGEGDEGKAAEIAELDEAITKAKMPKEVEQQARKELRRLQRMPEAAAEYGMVRTYLDWLIELPWALPEETPIDIAEARRILDEDHYGLEKIKRRIIEYLAVRKLAPHGKAPILCFVGPPGVGKTSLGQSIARAMNRKFVRVSLGGVHDEAEIRGHRRTYIGALPGNIIQAIRKAGARNCVMMLDEIDKLGAGIQGDPGSALLEVLDPEQNSTFRDNYLAVPFDLSRVVFITTANMLDTIPGPLRDRMEIITPRRLHGGGKAADRPPLSGSPADGGKRRCSRARSRSRTRRSAPSSSPIRARPGCVTSSARSERRCVTRRCASPQGESGPIRIDRDDLAAILGPPQFESEVAHAHERAGRGDRPRLDAGRRRHPVHRGDADSRQRQVHSHRPARRGDAGKRPGRAQHRQEPRRRVGIDANRFEKSDIHIHMPAGAIPKDGPSAGVAMFMALVSLLTERTVRSDTAMTGEISLRGLVLPVGGIKEKVIAAHRAGIKRVMLPARNRKDFEDIPEEVRRELEFVWLERVDEAIASGLEFERRGRAGPPGNRRGTWRTRRRERRRGSVQRGIPTMDVAGCDPRTRGAHEAARAHHAECWFSSTHILTR